MSVTFSGAFTFNGGGLTLTMAPTVATAGWFGGGGVSPPASVSTVDRITFATDTATASSRGPLSSARYALAGAGTLTYGWFGGGYLKTPAAYVSTVDRITYSTDTATASVRGPLSIISFYNSATSDGTTYGWFAIGFSGAPLSTVTRITYATDTNTSTARGPLSLGRYALTGTGTSSYGWFMGGFAPGVVSTVDRITYATDTATASARGPISIASDYSGGAVTDSTTYGWLAIGFVGAPTYRVSTVNRITYATDTDIASVRGPLADTRYNTAAACDNTYGWFGGGYVNVINSSTVTRITFANDTATSTDRGSLSLARKQPAGTSGLQ